MAIKTQSDVERSFFAYVKQSNIGQSVIGGSVVRSGMRQKDATSEDAVTSCIAISYAQTQVCELSICIYVADKKDKSGDYKTDFSRFATLEAAVAEFARTFKFEDFTLTSYETAREEIESIHQHTLTVRLHVKRISDDY